MSVSESTSGPAAAAWTCPFCPLLCDSFSVDAGAGGLVLVGSECPRARSALTHFGGVDYASAQPQVDGVACDLETAIAAAARLLAASRQPLFGGLGCDVAGARALYVLASRTGAICDPAEGATLMHGLRAQQDRGGFTTTLAEVRTRADLVVCIGALPTERHPEFLRRCGVGESSSAQFVVLQSAAEPVAEPAVPGIEIVRHDGDVFDAVALLAACVAGRAVGAAGAALAPLAARLHAARYAVLVYETGRLPAHGALVVEAINRIVSTLNQRSRAAALPLGGGDGASTVNAVFTWLSGLPIRSRAAPYGLEHEPQRFDARRLLADRSVDALLWIASFGTEAAPPLVALPRVVLAHPRYAAAVQGAGTVFIPVSTPGIGSAGHLFRTDGVVLLPLSAVRDDGLPTVADVVGGITREMTR